MAQSVETRAPTSALLRHLTLFSGLSDDELDRLINLGQELQVDPGYVLMREGEPGDALFVILEGEFEIVKEVNRSPVVIAKRGTGEVIGEIALLDDEPRSATVRALVPGRLYRIDRDAFLRLLSGSPSAMRAILRTVTSRLRNTESMLIQSEKMAALGTLAAGIAHELNNPAAAAKRAARQLAVDLRAVAELEIQFDALPLEPARRAAFDELRKKLDLGTVGGSPVDPLDRADLESELETWLAGRAIPDAWDVAPRLAQLGFTVSRLDELAVSFSETEITPLLQWLAARSSVEALLGEIASSTERISSIVAAIKSYVYLDQAPVQAVDIHTGIEDTLVILHFKLKHGITVKREYGRGLPRIEAYGSELNQVWTNLIDNAIDAMQGQGELTIRTYAEGIERVVVEICDGGPGIPVELQKRIFDPFFTTKPIGKGTGLGLHIVYNIVVLRHHGQVTLDSRPGRTCFQVSLPVSQKGVQPS